MGFGVIIAIVIVLCVFWRFCCRMMNGQASGKVAPTNQDHERPSSGDVEAEEDDDTEGL